MSKMPAKTTESKFDKFGDTQRAVEAAKNAPLKYGFIELPPGLSGIARLAACAVKETDEGVPYWTAEGTIEQCYDKSGPAPQFRGLPVYLSIFADKEKFEKQLARITDEIRKLGGERIFDDNPGITPDAASELLMKVRPPIRFRFSTSMGTEQIDPRTGQPKINPRTNKPFEPKVFVNFNGTRGLEDAPPPPTGGASAFKDSTGPASKNGTSSLPPKAVLDRMSAPTPVKKSDDIDGMDVPTLLERADKGKDPDAQKRLCELCVGQGIDEKEFWDKMSWDDVRDALLGGGEKKDKEVAGSLVSADPDFDPSDTEVVWYAPPDPRKRGKSLPPVECTLDSVNKKKKTATVTAAESGEEYENVPWDKLLYQS